jgi:very-short-patch-repair endonuclease
MTDAERLLWSKLRRKQLAGACFYRQRIIGEYIVYFYCREAALIIELDGGPHFHGDVKENDAVRDEFFRKSGFRVFRFDNEQVLKTTEAVLEQIHKAVTGGSYPLYPPFSKGENSVSKIA